MSGRPAVGLTPDQMSEVETLAAVQNGDQIADYVGIGRTTFFAMIQRDPANAERYKRGKARAMCAVAQTLISKARAGGTASMIFFLKTQGGWRETVTFDRKDPLDVGRPDLSLLSGEDLLRMLGVLDTVIGQHRTPMEEPGA